MKREKEEPRNGRYTKDEPRKWRVTGPDGRHTYAVTVSGWKPEFSSRQEKHRADREPMICYQGGKRLQGEDETINKLANAIMADINADDSLKKLNGSPPDFNDVKKWSEEKVLLKTFGKDFPKGCKLAYTSPPFTKADRFKPEKVREESCLVEVTADVTPTRWNDSTEMKDITFYWDELKGEWNSLHGKQGNKQPANNGEMFKDARFMRWFRKWCKGFLKRYSVGGKGGTLPEVYKLYGTAEFKEENAIVKSFRCEDVESLAMEFLWRYADIVKIKGEYCLTYYRRRLEEYFIKDLIKRGAEKNKQMQQGADFHEDVTELYSWDGAECGIVTAAQYGSASGGESDENEVIANAYESV